MTTLLPHCDAKCHRANPEGKCHCPSCGGALHGAGNAAPHLLAALIERGRIKANVGFALGALEELGIHPGQQPLPGMEYLK